MQKMTVPVLGGGVRQGTNYVKNADGTVAVAGESQASGPAPSDSVNPPPTATPDPIPERPRTLLEQFHPQLGPDKEITWDEKTGKIRISLKPEPTEPEAEEVPDTAELPPLGEQHETIIDAVTQAPPAQSGETQELKAQVGQLTQLVTLMIQAQAQGKPLAEVLGQPTQPQEPNYDEIDMYDPAQAAKMFRDIVKSEIQASMRQHQPALESARIRQEYDSVEAQYKHEPNYRQKIVTALQIVAADKQRGVQTPIQAAYETATTIHQSLSIPATPQSTAAATPKAQNPSLTNQPRTLTPEQAAQKAEQAKRLPGNTGVRGASGPQMPSNIRELGQMIAWNAQHASQI